VLAVLYDIHGNLPALDEVLKDTDATGADSYLLGGDFAPWSPWPRETTASRLLPRFCQQVSALILAFPRRLRGSASLNGRVLRPPKYVVLKPDRSRPKSGDG
jgi:hypothetical protein